MTTLILDLETTGFGSSAEILQIGIIDLQGNIIMNQYIKPKICELTDTWSHAVEIHGITPERVINCPHLESLIPALQEILCDKPLVIFNKRFDLGFLPEEVKVILGDVSCCMDDFTLAFQGVNKPSKSLEFACNHIGYEFDKEHAHDAIYDCMATLAVWKWLTGRTDDKQDN